MKGKNKTRKRDEEKPGCFSEQSVIFSVGVGVRCFSFFRSFFVSFFFSFFVSFILSFFRSVSLSLSLTLSPLPLSAFLSVYLSSWAFLNSGILTVCLSVLCLTTVCLSLSFSLSHSDLMMLGLQLNRLGVFTYICLPLQTGRKNCIWHE